MRSMSVLVAAALLGHAAASQAPSPTVMPADADIRAILTDRIDTRHQGVGIVAGVIDAGGRRIVAHGSGDVKTPQPLNGGSLFEIGSATKVFTSLLLADAVRRGEVALTDPASKYLPPEVRMPQRGSTAITLQDLAMHVSGLPRLPTNLAPNDRDNPYADYTVPQRSGTSS